MTLPYTETQAEDFTVTRTFLEDIDPIELMWHRDDEDRVIESINRTDWLIQLEDSLPIEIAGKINIPRHKWHRLIKGTGNLTVKIIKM
jgi:hypothetical protein